MRDAGRAVLQVVHKELRETHRDRTLAVALLAVMLLGIVAALSGGLDAHRRAQINGAAQVRDYERWLAQPERNPHSASHFGTSAFYVPSRLATLDPGVVPYVGAALFLEAHRQNEPAFAEAPDGGAVQRMGRLSLAGVIQVWLPLLVIALAAGAFASEREDGTLAFLLGLGITPMRLLLGKALAVAMAVLAVLAPGAVVSAVLLGRIEGVWPDDAAWRLGIMAAAAALYLLFWLALTLAVSLRATGSRLAMAILLACWCVSVVVVPRMSADLARVAHPLPSRAELDRLEIESRIQTPESYGRLRQQILTDYGVATPEALPLDINVIYAQRAEARINQRLDQRSAELWTIFQEERRDVQRAAILSPTVALDLISMAAAGSDDVHHRHFLKQAEAYRRQMMAVLGDAERRKPGEKVRQGTSELWQRLPPFRFRVPLLSEAQADVGMAFGMLTLWVLASLLLAAASVRRVVPR
jgi:ABC-2 type transport system permease protein